MTPFESEVWLAQRERRAQARRNSQMKRLVLVILAESGQSIAISINVQQ